MEPEGSLPYSQASATRPYPEPTSSIDGHWWSPIISSAYGVNRERRMLDNILYVVGKSDMPL